MADKKSPPPSPSYSLPEILLLLILFSSFASLVTNWLNKNREVWSSILDSLPFYIINIYSKYVVFAFFLSIALFILAIIYVIKENKVRQKLMNRVIPSENMTKTISEGIVIENSKWKIVQDHINSDDASKWKLAILEADIILSELLNSLNLLGDGIGEKLKNVEASDFDHIEEAWEAHKIRNAIAHEGSDFLLTQREAKRIIELYRSVFEEFEII